MNIEQMKELLQFNEKESKIFLPNEIFVDLKKSIHNSPHLAFTYSYTYFITWQYRYAKHITAKGIIDNARIKEILGYNATTKGLDYITKKNGILDRIGYTETVKDFPTSWTFEDSILEFDMYSENKENLTHLNLSRKFSVKYPVKSFHRYDQEVEDGTFYEFENTYCIPFEVFMYCMCNEEIGTIGFYLYSYIKRMNNLYSDGWDVSFEGMINETKLPDSTLEKYLDQLRKYRLVEAIHNQEYFCRGLSLKERKANTYHVNDFESFTYEPQGYEKIKIIKVKEYKKMREEELVIVWGKKSEIPLEELPY
jgi:hypothetical protein